MPLKSTCRLTSRLKLGEGSFYTGYTVFIGQNYRAGQIVESAALAWPDSRDWRAVLTFFRGVTCKFPKNITDYFLKSGLVQTYEPEMQFFRGFSCLPSSRESRTLEHCPNGSESATKPRRGMGTVDHLPADAVVDAGPFASRPQRPR